VTTFQLLTKITVQINQVTSYKTFDTYANNCASCKGPTKTTTCRRPCGRRRMAESDRLWAVSGQKRHEQVRLTVN